MFYLESDIYEDNQGKDVYTFRNENNQKKSPINSADNYHQKRLTFGAESNFDQEVISSQNNCSVTEENKSSPHSQVRSSPSRQASQEIGNNYPSFRVAFGKTESKFKRNQSPEQTLLYGINSVPKKKRVDHLDQTYDVVRGVDIPVNKSKSKTPTGLSPIEVDFGSVITGITRDFTQVAMSEIGQESKVGFNKESILSPTSEKRVNTLNE